MEKLKIRNIEQADIEVVENICFETGFMGDSAKHFWNHKESFVKTWLDYYINNERSSFFIATYESKVVGYLSGCLYTEKAPKIEKVVQDMVKKYWLLYRPGTARFFIRSITDTLIDKDTPVGELRDGRWPSHLPINLSQQARGIGAGKALMETWLDYADVSGSPGCHLGTAIENTRAIRFFENFGFRKYGEPRKIPGIRGKHRERLHEQIMVRDA